MKRIKTGIIVLMIVLVSAISILSDAISFSVTSDFFNTGYWLRAAIINTSAIMVLFLANSIRKDKVMETNKVYIERKNALAQAYKDLGESGLTNEFKAYIEADNKREKLRVYNKKMNAKLVRVNNYIQFVENTINALRVFFRLKTIETPKTLTLLLARFRKKRIEYRIENAEKHINYVYVRYIKVRYSAIFGESEKMSGEERDIFFRTAVHNAGIVFKKAVFVILIGTLSLMQVGDLITNFSLFTVYQMCMRIFTIALSIYAGISDADNFVGKRMCDVLLRRLSYVQDFVNTKK